MYATDNWLLGAVKGTVKATVKVTAYRCYDVTGSDGHTIVEHYEDSDSVTLTLEGKLRSECEDDGTSGPLERKQIFSLIQDGDTAVTASGGGASSSWTRSSTRDASWSYAADPDLSMGLVATLTTSYVQIQPGSTTAVRYEIPGDGVANWFGSTFAVTGTVTTTEKDQDGKSSSPLMVPIASCDCNFAPMRISAVIGDWRDHAGEGEKLAGDDMTYQDMRFTCSRKITHGYTKAGEERDSFTVFGSLEVQCDLAADPLIRGILVNQALGRISFSKNPDIDVLALPMDAVAGKELVIQVLFPDGLAAGTAGEVTVEVRKDDRQLARLSTFEVDDQRNQLIFDPGDTSGWEAGTYTFSAMLGADVKKTVETKFQKQKNVRILAVPVKANFGGGSIATPGDNWQSADSYMRAVYPLSRENVKWKIGEALDAADERFNLSTENGQIALWALLNEQQSFFLEYDLIVGVIGAPIPMEAGGQASGFTAGKPSVVAASSVPSFPKTIAHELGHVYLLGDEYNNGSFSIEVNPPPFGYAGTDLNDPTQQVISGALDIDPGPGDGNLSGSLVSAKLFPWEYHGRGPLPDLQCFMGGGRSALSTYWISPNVWSHLYDILSADADDADTATGASGGGALKSGNGGTRMVDASGWIRSSGEVTLDKPWRSYVTSEPFTVAANGLYTIAAVDASGKPLALQVFTPSFLALSDPPFALDPAPFNVAVPFPEGTVKFQIASPAGLANILKEVPVYANSPAVAISAPAAGSVCAGLTSIAWAAGHPDGAVLSYDVEYSHDGQDWTVIAWRLSQTGFSKDFSTLAGSDQALIRVIASDGVNATVATSERFRVPYKPPQVFIEEPIQSAQGVVLNGRGYDLTDGWIYETSQLSWTSDSGAALGSGTRLLLNNLSLGHHTFTLTATNRHGLSASKSIVATS